MSLVNGKVLESAIALVKLGGNCMQIFVSSPMVGRLSDKHMKYYKDNGPTIKEHLLDANIKTFIHSPYVYNFAKPIPDNSTIENCYWITNYIKELIIAHLIGAVGCVIHVGKYLNLSIEEAEENMFNSLQYVINYIIEHNLNSIIILETAAGQGTELFTTTNNTLDKLANFYNRFKNYTQYIKICVDTCHIYSAGYNIADPTICTQFFTEFDSKIGFNNLALIHLNDSKTDYDSNVDRHENLGQGKIGIDSLMLFIYYSLHLRIPIVLETPECATTTTKLNAINEIALIKQITDYQFNTHTANELITSATATYNPPAENLTKKKKSKSKSKKGCCG